MMTMEEENCFETSLGGLVELTGPETKFFNKTGGALSPGQSKYAQLLAVIEEMGRDLRPSYAGNKSSAEKLKRGIVHARILVRECLTETERSARQ